MADEDHGNAAEEAHRPGAHLPQIEVTQKRIVLEDDEVIGRASPRLVRAMKTTGVIWDQLIAQDIEAFTMDYAVPVPRVIAFQRLNAHLELRSRNLQTVLKARKALVNRKATLDDSRSGAKSAPPEFGEKVLTPLEMAQKRAEEMLELAAIKRQQLADSEQKRLEDERRATAEQMAMKEKRQQEMDRVAAKFEVRCHADTPSLCLSFFVQDTGRRH